MLNKKVLSSQRKVRNDEAVCRDTGRVFHARTAATGNARSWMRLHPCDTLQRERENRQTLILASCVLQGDQDNVSLPCRLISVTVMCIFQMAFGSKSDIDILVSCIRNSVIVTSEETGQCELIPPPLASETADVAKLLEMYAIVFLLVTALYIKAFNRVTTHLENLEKSGNSKVVREKVRENGKSQG